MPRASERTLLFLVGAVQFVNVLDYMMVLPLGPDFAAALGIPTSQLGYVGAAYTAAAAAAGLAGSLFLDRFDRRSALAVAMLGLVVGTAAGGFARGLGSMMAARLVAGAFGGPATALSLAIVSDAVPPERRGRALGRVMGAFSIAAVVGVPAGLEAARLGGWWLPFLGVAGLGLLLAGAALALMPPMRGHLAAGAQPAALSPLPLLRRPLVLLSLLTTLAVTVAHFSVLPNLFAFLQHNLGYPRAHLGRLYVAGGLTTVVTMRLAGRLIDRVGAPRVAAGATALLLGVFAALFLGGGAGLPVAALFVGFMVGNSTRNVSMNAVTTRVPPPEERARFMSLQSAVQHVGSSVGALVSAWLLASDASGRLDGMPRVAALAMALAVTLPFLLRALRRGVRTREAVPSGPPRVDRRRSRPGWNGGQ